MTSDSKVETVWRLARWKIMDRECRSSRRSDSFRIGIWNWYLMVKEDPGDSYFSSRRSHRAILLYMIQCLGSEEQLPQAKFVIRASNFVLGQKPLVSPVSERLFQKGKPLVFHIEMDLVGELIIDVEFLDLKISTVKDDEASSCLLPENWMKQQVQKSSHLRFARMFQENIHTDIMVKVSDGTLPAHKAILAVSSPVFCGMLRDDLLKKDSSIIELEAMSLESCRVLFNYLYGIMERENLWMHRHELLSVAVKYDIADLKECCEESLLEDITTENVLERLQCSWHYQLSRLKKKCLSFLFDFGKINDIKDKICAFVGHAGQEQVDEMFQKMLAVWSQT